jgi:hypothetical protein
MTSPDLRACEFCEWETAEIGWIVTLPPLGYGLGPNASEPVTLCQLCRNSHAVSTWLAGGRLENVQIARDQLMIGNRLRTDLLDGLRNLAGFISSGGRR